MKIKFLKYLSVFSLLLTWCLSCNPKEDVPPQTDDTEQNMLKVPSSTKILDENTLALLIEVAEDQSRFVFRAKNTFLESVSVNDIILLGESDLTPLGALAKITTMAEEQGKFVLYTQPASLTEAIEEAHYHIKKVIKPDDVRETILQDGVTPLNSEKSSGGAFAYALNIQLRPDLKLEGKISFEPEIDFDLDLGFFSIERLNFKASLKQESTLKLIYSSDSTFLEEKKEIARFRLAPLIPSSLVVTPVLVLEVGVTGKVTVSVQPEVSVKMSGHLGINYENGAFKPLDKDFNISASTHIIDLPGVNFSAKAFAKLSSELYILGQSAVSTGAIEAFFKVNVGPFEDPCWKISAGLSAKPTLNVNLFGYQLAEFATQEISYTIPVAQSQGPCLPPGRISGRVKHALSEEPLQGVKVQVFKNDNLIGETSTDAYGRYEIEVVEGEKEIVRFNLPGYLEAVYNNVEVRSLQTTFLEAVLQIDEAYSGNGKISGLINDAITGWGVPDLLLKLREGIYNQEGEVLATSRTGSGGFYSFENIPAGNYTIEASGEGYITMFFNVISIGGTEKGNQNATISSESEQGLYRIVLTWGSTPEDLDAHLTGPDGYGQRFHIYWSNKNPYGIAANLDIDDVTSYGPETVTITELNSGIYRYSIHDYSHLNSASSNALSLSGARVQVYQDGQLIYNYNVPSQEGTLWTVFEIENNQIRSINEMSYESRPSNVKSGSGKNDAAFINRMPKKK